MMSPRKGGERRAELVVSGASIAGSRDRAVRVVGVAGFTEAQGEAVKLGAVHDVGHRLGGAPEGDGEHAGGERVERAAVPGLLRVECPAHLVHGGGAVQAWGLVEDEPPAEGAAAATGGHGSEGLGHEGNALSRGCRPQAAVEARERKLVPPSGVQIGGIVKRKAVRAGECKQGVPCLQPDAA